MFPQILMNTFELWPLLQKKLKSISLEIDCLFLMWMHKGTSNHKLVLTLTNIWQDMNNLISQIKATYFQVIELNLTHLAPTQKPVFVFRVWLAYI